MQWSSTAVDEELLEAVLGVVPDDVVLGGGGALNVELLDGGLLDDEGIGGILNVELLDGGLLEDEGIGGTLKVELLDGRSLDVEGSGGTLKVELLDGMSLDDEGIGGILNVELLDGRSLDDELLEDNPPEDDMVSGFPAVVTLLELDDVLANESLLLDESAMTVVESLELLSGTIELLEDELIGGSSLNVELLELDDGLANGTLELDKRLDDELAMTAVESLELLSGITESLDEELLGSGSLDDELPDGNSLDDDDVSGFPAVSLLLELDDGFAILLDELAMTAVESLELLSGITESLDEELLDGKSLDDDVVPGFPVVVMLLELDD